jgi:hypothetical protein
VDTKENMTCEQLQDTVADGWARLDAATRARCEEHAKTCPPCAEEIALAKDDDAFFEEGGKGETTRPEVKAKILARIAAEKQPRPFRIELLLLVLALVAVGVGGVLVGRAFNRSEPANAAPPLRPGSDIDLGGVEPTTPNERLGRAHSLHRKGQDAEARKWATQVAEDPKATDEMKAEARKLLAELKDR